MEAWKNDIMNSLDGIQKAQPPSDTFSKIQRKIRHKPNNNETNPTHWWAIAATISFVILCNVYIISTHSEQTPTADVSNYPSLITDYNLYQE